MLANLRTGVDLTLAVFLLLAIAGCKASVISHDEEDAALAAVRFAQTAFVTRDIENAYGLLAPELQAKLPLKHFQASVNAMHLDRFPRSLRATDYEPNLGTENISIFVNGRDGFNEYYYRILMIGTRDSGYRVGGFYRKATPYDRATSRRKLRTPVDSTSEPAGQEKIASPAALLTAPIVDARVRPGLDPAVGIC